MKVTFTIYTKGENHINTEVLLTFKDIRTFDELKEYILLIMAWDHKVIKHIYIWDTELYSWFNASRIFDQVNFGFCEDIPISCATDDYVKLVHSQLGIDYKFSIEWTLSVIKALKESFYAKEEVEIYKGDQGSAIGKAY